MLDTVTDGTPCFMNNKSRNICVNGVCKVVWLGKRLKEAGVGVVAEQDMRQTVERVSCHFVIKEFIRANLSSHVFCNLVCPFPVVCTCVFVCRRSVVTTALTQTQWRIAVESV